MPIKSAPYYYAVCDNCGERADYDDFSAFEEAATAVDYAIAGDWTQDGEKFHCPDCPSLDAAEKAQGGAP